MGYSLKVDGITLGLRSNDPATLEALSQFVPSWAQQDSSREVDCLLSFYCGKPSQRRGLQNYHLVYKNWTQAVRTLSLEHALDIANNVIYDEVQQNATDRTYLDSQLARHGDTGILLVGDEENVNPLLSKLEPWGVEPVVSDWLGVDGQGRAHYSDLKQTGSLEVQHIWIIDPRRRKKAPQALTPGQTTIILSCCARAAHTKPASVVHNLGRLSTRATAHQGQPCESFLATLTK